MSKFDMVRGMNSADAILEACSKTLSLLAENIDQDNASVLFGVICHIDTVSDQLDGILEAVCEKVVEQ